MRLLFTLVVLAVCALLAQEPRKLEQALMPFNASEKAAVSLIFREAENARRDFCFLRDIPHLECGQITPDGVYRIQKVEPTK